VPLLIVSPTAAFAIHSEIHAARPEVACAAHSHSTNGRAFCATGRTLDMITQDSCVFYNDHVLYRYGFATSSYFFFLILEQSICWSCPRIRRGKEYRKSSRAEKGRSTRQSRAAYSWEVSRGGRAVLCSTGQMLRGPTCR
jgi:hypothetical protein